MRTSHARHSKARLLEMAALDRKSAEMFRRIAAVADEFPEVGGYEAARARESAAEFDRSAVALEAEAAAR